MAFKTINFTAILIATLLIQATYSLTCTQKPGFQVTNMPLFKDSEDFPCAYSGFIEINPGQDLFYWYFKNTEVDAAKDDLPMLLWLNGGPGASSMTGLFKENGPIQIDYSQEGNLQVSVREKSWLDYSHLLFVDQPVGTGFSFSTEGGYIGTEQAVAEQFTTFLEKFVKEYPETSATSGMNWNFIGESYAGKYTPWISKHILELKTEDQPIKLDKIGLVDPLIFGLLQKTTTRNEIYGGLGIFDPVQMNQFNLLQENCARGIYQNSPHQTEYCGKTEDYMTEQTAGIHLTDIRTFEPEVDILDLYFNKQSTEIQTNIMDAIHISDTTKTRPNIFKSDPEVYAAFAKTNDIYGEESLTIIKSLITEQKKPFIIMEGVMDTLDGILGLEIYKNEIISDDATCQPRQLIKQNRDDEKCVPIGFVQQCGEDGKATQLLAVGVWSAGHLIPENQLIASDFIFNQYITGGDFCDEGCDCSQEKMKNTMQTVLNDCYKQGDVVQVGEAYTCQCSDSLISLSNCAMYVQQFDVSKGQPLKLTDSAYQQFSMIGFSKLTQGTTNLEFQIPQGVSIEFSSADLKPFNMVYHNTTVASLYIQQNLIIEDGQITLTVRNQPDITDSNGTQKQVQFLRKTATDDTTTQVGLTSGDQDFAQGYFTNNSKGYFPLPGIGGFILSLVIFLATLLFMIGSIYQYKKASSENFHKSNTNYTEFQDSGDNKGKKTSSDQEQQEERIKKQTPSNAMDDDEVFDN